MHYAILTKIETINFTLLIEALLTINVSFVYDMLTCTWGILP